MTTPPATCHQGCPRRRFNPNGCPLSQQLRCRFLVDLHQFIPLPTTAELHQATTAPNRH